MAVLQFARNYQQAAIKTATPGQLILMLMDGALRAMATAQAGFRIEAIAPRIEQINNQLLKAQAIIRELKASLDLRNGGEFAGRMWGLYDFMLDRLSAANIAKDPEPVGIVEKLLREIRDAWATMLEKSATEAA
jgi:flagellar protein FliS